MAGATKKLLSDFENFSTYIRNLNSVFQYQINSSNKATLTNSYHQHIKTGP